jgi:hypothetical protein
VAATTAARTVQRRGGGISSIAVSALDAWGATEVCSKRESVSVGDGEGS